MDWNTLLNNLVVPDVSIVEKVIRPILVYGFLIVLLRIAGQRTLSQMNAFDLIVLLTLSNTVQNAIIGNDNSVLGGMIGATTLVVVNVLVVRYLYKHQGLDRRLEGEPIVLVENGRFLRKNCERALITEDEVMAAIRRQGAAELADVDRVVLETSGTVSVILHHPTGEEAISSEMHERLGRIEAALSRLEQGLSASGARAT
jgi:uncharacterized membrane protein YcaP (DUF421 family)